MRHVIRVELRYGDLHPSVQYLLLMPDGRCELTHRKGDAPALAAERAAEVVGAMLRAFAEEAAGNPALKSYSVTAEPA